MRISQKLLAMVVVVFLLVYAMFGYLSIGTITKEKYIDLDSRLQSLTNIALASSRNDIWSYDIDGLKQFIDSFSAESIVDGIIFSLDVSHVENNKKELIGQVNGETLDLATAEPEIYIPSSGTFYRVVERPILWNDAKIATMYLFFGDESVARDVNGLVRIFILSLVLSLVIMIVVIYLSMRSIVIRPFERLQQACKSSEREILALRDQIEEEHSLDHAEASRVDELIDTMKQLPVKNDEIGNFTNSFIRLLETVRTALTEVAERTSQLSTLNETLEEKISKRTAALEHSNEALTESIESLKQAQIQMVHQEKLASIGHLAAGVAHEINNPIGFISSNLNSLNTYIEDIRQVLDAYAAIKPEMSGEALNAACQRVREVKQEIDFDYVMQDLVELIKDCNEGSARVKEIVNNLKDFSRVEDNTEQQIFDIKKEIENTLKLVNNELKYSCTVELDLENKAKVVGHRGAINQVISNLLVNAGHAIEETGEQGVIRILSYDEENWVVIKVSDTGCGMSEEVLKKIYDPFFTTKDVGVGTGLGLNISYDIIVNKNNGELVCDSTAGKGTTFTIKLPREGTVEVKES